MPTPLSDHHIFFWSVIVTLFGWLSTVVAGVFVTGRVIGKINRTIDDHERMLLAHEKQLVDNHVMTEEACRRFHKERQEAQEVVLEQLKSSQIELKGEIRKATESLQRYQLQLATAMGRMETFANQRKTVEVRDVN